MMMVMLMMLKQVVKVHHSVNNGQLMRPGKPWREDGRVRVNMPGNPWVNQLMVRRKMLLHFRAEEGRRSSW